MNSNPEIRPAREVTPAIDDLLGRLHEIGLPGVAIGVAVGGVPVYRKAAGRATMDLPVDLAPHMRMRIYSITKHFTCFAYLLLCEDGLASIDDPLTRHFPEFDRSVENVTMRDILTNRSGLRDAFALSYQLAGTEWYAPSEAIAALYEGISLQEAAPGERWMYNSGGYILLGQAIERITGQSLGDVFEERIFAPIGMHDTLVRRTDSDFLPNSATMHTRLDDGTFCRRYIGGDRGGSSAIVSTIDDMLRWLAHLGKPAIGSEATWALMTSAQRLANGASTNYGCGLGRSRYRGFDVIEHPGSGMGASAHLLKVPEAGLDIMVLANRGDVSSTAIAIEILDLFIGGDIERISNGDVRPVNAVYRSGTTGRVLQLLEAGGEQALYFGGFGDVLLARSGGLLTPAASTVLPFALSVEPLDGAWPPRRLRLIDYGESDEVDLLDGAPAKDAAVPAGNYRGCLPGFEISVSGSELASQGPFGTLVYRLTPLAPNIWLAATESSATSFMKFLISLEEGQLILSNQSTRGIRFEKMV